MEGGKEGGREGVREGEREGGRKDMEDKEGRGGRRECRCVYALVCRLTLVRKLSSKPNDC